MHVPFYYTLFPTHLFTHSFPAKYFQVKGKTCKFAGNKILNWIAVCHLLQTKSLWTV